jgi:general stress protein 26
MKHKTLEEICRAHGRNRPNIILIKVTAMRITYGDVEDQGEVKV